MTDEIKIYGVCACTHCGYAVTGVHPTHCCVGCFKYDSKGCPYSRHGVRCEKIADSSRIFYEAMNPPNPFFSLYRGICIHSICICIFASASIYICKCISLGDQIAW